MGSGFLLLASPYRAKAFRAANHFGDFRVRARLAIGNGFKGFPYLELEFGSVWREGNVEEAALACEIFLQLRSCLVRKRARTARAIVCNVAKSNRANARLVGGDAQSPHGHGVYKIVRAALHGHPFVCSSIIGGKRCGCVRMNEKAGASPEIHACKEPMCSPSRKSHHQFCPPTS